MRPRIVLVDDEDAARRRLASLLAGLEVEIVGEAANGLQAIDLIARVRPDVVLLDIAMPEVDGFDVVRHLPEPRPFIIFQTAYHEHAVKAFEHEALDYLLKPVRRERLAAALDRAARRGRVATVLTPELLARIARAAGHGPGERRSVRLLVRQGAGHRLVALRDVVRFVAEDRLVYAEFTGGRALTDYTLQELAVRFGRDVIRTSRGELVNASRVDRLVSNGDGSATLTMTGGLQVRVSRRRAAEVRTALDS